MPEPWLGVVEKVTEFFVTAQIEACARRTGFVRRTSKLTGKVFLALVTVGTWSQRRTSLGQLAAKAAQVPTPGCGCHTERKRTRQHTEIVK